MICINFQSHNLRILMYHSVLKVLKKVVGLSFSKLSFKVASVYVTGFAKTVPNRTRIGIPFIAWHES